MEIDDFLDLGMEVGLLFDALIQLLEERLVDKLFDAAHGEVRHEVLAVAEVAQAVEGVEDIAFKVIECLGLIFHAQPEHPG